MRVLITGGTGLLGNNLIRQALGQGLHVSALVRSKDTPKSLLDLDIEIHQGDICDASSLQAAASGVDAIIHCAAHIHIGWKFLEEAMRVNVGGTQNVVQAAKSRGLRLVHVSTVNTLAMGTRDHPADEETPGDGQIPCTYVLSKRASEKAVTDAARDGLDAVIVHPGFMLGPWDWKPSSGRMIREIAMRWTPFSPSGGCSVCDVRDVADGVIQALQRGQPGRHYILAGENLTYMDLWKRFARELRKSAPIAPLGPAARLVVGSVGDLASKFGSAESDINSAAIRISAKYQWHSSQRAIDELDYRFRASDIAIVDAVKWLREYGYLR